MRRFLSSAALVIVLGLFVWAVRILRFSPAKFKAVWIPYLLTAAAVSAVFIIGLSGLLIVVLDRRDKRQAVQARPRVRVTT